MDDTKTAEELDIKDTERHSMDEDSMEELDIKGTERHSTDGDSMENLTWEEIGTEHLVRDEWIDFKKTDYRLPDGKVYGPFYSYSNRDCVVIVATDEQGDYLCVRQYRQGIRKVTTEFPAGGIERGDGIQGKDGIRYGTECDPAASEGTLEAARRELLEETGYESDEWKYLLAVPIHATITDNRAYIFMARNCRKAGEQHLDETEFLHVRKHSAAEIQELIEKGQFQQAVHILAFLLCRRG